MIVGIFAPAIFAAMLVNINDGHGNVDPSDGAILFAILVLLYVVIVISMIAALWRIARNKCDIPTEGECEDCCCALCCIYYTPAD